MLKGTPKRTLFMVLVAVAICMVFLSQYFHRQAPQPNISSLSTNRKILHAREKFGEQGMIEKIILTTSNKTKPRGIWHENYTRKYDTGNLVGLWRILNKSYVMEHLDQPRIDDYICEDPLCSEFLTEKDLKQVERCADRFIKRQLIREGGHTLIPTCHFINGTSGASNVALISFPGSGNTWTRELLEKATGICTGEEHNSYHECMIYARLHRCITQVLCHVTCPFGCQDLLVKALTVIVCW